MLTDPVWPPLCLATSLTCLSMADMGQEEAQLQVAVHLHSNCNCLTSFRLGTSLTQRKTGMYADGAGGSCQEEG